jgi:hypothetical protein
MLLVDKNFEMIYNLKMFSRAILCYGGIRLYLLCLFIIMELVRE